jgi:hypothetical protein
MIRRSKLATNHDRYGELSALVLVNQATPAEYREWEAHLASCTACRAEYKDFSDILLTLPLVDDPEVYSGSLSEEPLEIAVSANMKKLASLQSRATFFGVEPEHGRSWWKQLQPAWISYAFGLAFAVTVGLSIWQLNHGAKHNQLQINEIATLKNQISAISQESRENAARSAIDLQRRSIESKQAATAAAEEYAQLQAHNRILNATVRTADEELTSLKGELEAYRNREIQLSSRAAQAEESLAQLRTELQRADREKDTTESKLHNREAELQAVTYQVDELRNGVERDRKLLAADRDIRDLMGARNLRIVDVFDVDGKGRTKKPFGRVFFTEGKSLIFYAFDLGQDRAVMQSASFQAWGTQGPSQPKARSLGIFYQDNQTANRWILKFDDPRVLAEIDSVFVTVEPHGGSNKPTGATLLSAYLKANLNHP